MQGNKPNPRDIYFGFDNRDRLLKGALTFSKAITKTMGPRSGIVIMDRMAGLLATKDGVTVARELQLKDPVENMGCSVLKEACINVNDEAGDGTTTTACLSTAILKEGHSLVVAGYEPMEMVRGLNQGAEFVREYLRSISADVSNKKTLQRVAMISSNHDKEIADTIAEACLAVGKNGTVVIEDGQGLGLELILKDGMEIDRGAVSTHFLDGQVTKEIANPLVAVIPKVLTNASDVVSMLECSSQWPDNDLLVICQGIEGEALKTMLVNHTKAIVKSCGVKAHGFGHRQRDYLEDIAVFSGADLIDNEQGFNLNDFQGEWFGTFRKAYISDKKSVFMPIEEIGDHLQHRVENLKGQLGSCKHEYDRDKLQERIAKLQGGFAIVRVGGFSENGIKERRARIEDTLGAVQSALKEGVVPGGGTAYYSASKLLTEYAEQFTGVRKMGMILLARALKAPMSQLASNSETSGEVVGYRIDQARSQESDEDVRDWIGWDAITGDVRDLASGDMVIDPLTVSVSALMNSVSVSGLLLTCEASIV
jgi:chaperonin GroEL